jgi:hypothetical protein
VGNGMGKVIGWAVLALVACVITRTGLLASLVITLVAVVIGAFGQHEAGRLELEPPAAPGFSPQEWKR